jgi:hypothetical protein
MPLLADNLHSTNLFSTALSLCTPHHGGAIAHEGLEKWGYWAGGVAKKGQ